MSEGVQQPGPRTLERILQDAREKYEREAKTSGYVLPVQSYPEAITAWDRGWLCPNCGSAHSPDVKTCPLTSVPSLRDRVGVK